MSITAKKALSTIRNSTHDAIQTTKLMVDNSPIPYDKLAKLLRRRIATLEEIIERAWDEYTDGKRE